MPSGKIIKHRQKKVEWEAVFGALEKWRGDLIENARITGSGGAKDTSVNTVAEHYRRSPWAVLASTIISLRTKDEVTLAASERLLEAAAHPAELAAMQEKKIEKLIYPAGFYRNKAASLKKIAAILLDQYGGKVPSSMEALLALPGVGRKTANLVLNEAFDLDAICVDIHVHRISNRCGWLSSKAPEETEMILREILPKKFWKRINRLLVLYGQTLCRPVSPFCSRCVIIKYCSKCDVKRTR